MIAVIKREKKIEFTSISLTLRSKELHGFTPDESLARVNFLDWYSDNLVFSSKL